MLRDHLDRAPEPAKDENNAKLAACKIASSCKSARGRLQSLPRVCLCASDMAQQECTQLAMRRMDSVCCMGSWADFTFALPCIMNSFSMQSWAAKQGSNLNQLAALYIVYFCIAGSLSVSHATICSTSHWTVHMQARTRLEVMVHLCVITNPFRAHEATEIPFQA